MRPREPADSTSVSVSLAAFAALPGLAIGSFLNVIAARVPLRRSIVHPASACMACEHEIAWYDNVPVVSWLLLRGRCRNCGARISIRYPAIELVTAVLVVGCFVAFGLSAYAVLASFFCIVLVTLSAIDVDHRIVPNRIVVPAAGIVLVAHTAIDPSPEWALGALGASGFLFLAALAYPRGMGMGDVKLALLLGAMLGRSVGLALLLGFIFALVPSCYLLVRHGMKARKMALPLVPFLALGSLVALFAGESVMDWYAGLLG
jgi:leader peptidase (prepilin peptidase)/N-methyltransferase